MIHDKALFWQQWHPQELDCSWQPLCYGTLHLRSFFWAIWDNQNPYYMHLFCQMLSHHWCCVWYNQPSPRAASVTPSACHLGHNLRNTCLHTLNFLCHHSTVQFACVTLKLWRLRIPPRNCTKVGGIKLERPRSWTFDAANSPFDSVWGFFFLSSQCLDSVSQSIPSMIGY